jgi:acyl carrier protein
MTCELLEEVKTFVAEFWGEPKNRLAAETSVNDDLGMDGDDGVEFMLEFGERFAVDLTAFPHDKYFGPEAGATALSMLVNVVRRVTTGKWSGLAPLTLRELADAAEWRKWAAESPTEI